MLILGIESSCDETAAAVLTDEPRVLSSVVASQVTLHHSYGGVVPELASREHLKNIRPVVRQALEDAGTDFSQLNYIAVTYAPGLIGSLLVGVTYAKGLSYSLGIPLIPIHHLEGHIFAVELEHGPFPYPALILIVSGGHSTLVFSERREHYLLVARTRDDAAGEAYDKVAKLVGLGYPGGPVLDRLAAEGDAKAYPLPIARTSDGSLDLSFSGIKTAVMRLVQEQKIPAASPPGQEQPAEIKNLAASFQYTVIATLLDRVKRAARHLSPRSIILSGGVACNRGLREIFLSHFQAEGIPVLYPRPSWTTDNAAMIAAAALPKARRGECADSGLNAFASLPLTREKIALPNPLKNN